MPDHLTLFEDTVLTREQQQQVARLLLRLGSSEHTERWTAQTELRRMEPLPLPVLIAHMARLERVRKQAPFLLFLGLFASGFLLLGLLLIFDTVFGRVSRVPVLLAVLTTLALMLRRWLRLRAAAIRALAGYTDTRQIGPLAAVLAESWGDRETQRVAYALLLHLLPRVRRSAAPPLTPAQRGCLLTLLDSGDAALTIKLLQALSQIGDAQAEQRVRRLLDEAESAVQTEEPQPAAANEQVRDAARACLQALGAERIRLRLQQNLLRVVKPGDLQTDTAAPDNANHQKPTLGDNL